MSNLNNGHRERRLKAAHRRRCQATLAPCALCGQSIDYTAPRHQPDSFESDHIVPVSLRPDLAYAPSNLQPAHSRCNRARQATPMESTTTGGTGGWVRADW